MSSLVLVGLGVLILVIGLGLGYLFGNTIRARETAKASDIEAELNKYRSDVTEHFSQTAAHFQSIGQQYKDLYEHMALGAEALCDASQPGRELPFSPNALLPSDATAETTAEEVIADAAAEPQRDVEPQAVSASEDDVPADAVTEDETKAAAADELAAETESSGAAPDDERIYH